MLTALIDVMLELAPWLLIGMAVAGILHGVLPQDFVRRKLTGRMGVVRSVALGVPLPLCSCGVIPAGLGLRKDGASTGASLGFLISTPQTGVDSILVSASFLGWPFALFKVLAATVTGLVGGWISEGFEATAPSALGDEESSEAESAPQSRGMREMLRHSLELLDSIWRWLVLGIVVSALITVFVPEDSFAGLARLGPIVSGLAVLAISLPLYVCATASVPIAAALVASGMPTGAALVFLMAGPATNVATIGAIYRGFGGRLLSVYLATIVIGSVGFGALFDLSIDPGSVTAHSLHHETTWWAVASAVLLSGLILRLAIRDLRRNLAGRWPFASRDVLEIPVAGLTCNVCVNKLEGALEAVDGVDSVHVTRNPDRALLRGAIDRSRVEQAIREAGYQVG